MIGTVGVVRLVQSIMMESYLSWAADIALVSSSKSPSEKEATQTVLPNISILELNPRAISVQETLLLRKNDDFKSHAVIHPASSQVALGGADPVLVVLGRVPWVVAPQLLLRSMPRPLRSQVLQAAQLERRPNLHPRHLPRHRQVHLPVPTAWWRRRWW